MKWKKLGKIFNPKDHSLPNNCVEFAQSPQTLIFDDFVRIYFSTREKDNLNGKFKSHIAFVDFDKTCKQILRVSDRTVIELGHIGCFDEHGIFPINLLKDENKILAYTCGWSRRVTVSVETSTGLAISHDDGLTFQKVGDGPIFSNSLHEPFLVGDSFVRKYDDKYHMWYIFGQRWINNPDDKTSERVYKIAHAFSTNGIDWVRDSKPIISDVLGQDECQALPSVIYFNGKYHMYFCYRDAFGFRTNRDKAYRIGYAFSYDLIHWTRADELSGIDVTEDDWDGDMMCYPHIFECDGQIYLLYNGNEFGKEGFGLAILERESIPSFDVNQIEYKLNTSTELQILSHLQACDLDFKPPLSTRVDLIQYAHKIFSNAVKFEAWVDAQLVGLIAVYNNEDQQIGFITNVSVLNEFTGQKISTNLLTNVIQHAKQHHFNKLQLEVNMHNTKAIALYQSFKFNIYNSIDESLFFEFELNTKIPFNNL